MYTKADISDLAALQGDGEGESPFDNIEVSLSKQTIFVVPFNGVTNHTFHVSTPPPLHNGYGEIQTGGLANGGLAQKAPIGPKKALSGEFLLPPRGCQVRRNRSRSAQNCLNWGPQVGVFTSGGLRGVWPNFPEIGRNRPGRLFSAFFRRAQTAPGKSRKRRQKALFHRYPLICIKPHLSKTPFATLQLNNSQNHPLENPNGGSQTGLKPQILRENRAKILPGKSGLFGPGWSLFKAYRCRRGLLPKQNFCGSIDSWGPRRNFRLEPGVLTE